MDKVTLGAEAEELACGVLRQAGYLVVTRNWRTRLGEIDIVARDGDVLVFVEVKARSTSGFGGAEGAVGPAKQRRIIA
ncbi:MAG: YraN family protein, partial [Candidatus Bipolaricaulota bacterium]|nr:YraN family protein [Candidatus Bipolaricaulota bacterium]